MGDQQSAPLVLGPSETPSQGRFDTMGRNYVFMAFLDYDNDEYRPEEWARDYMLIPTNKLTTLLSSGPNASLFHCQMFFWHERAQTFITFSVDAHQQHVYASTMKQFERGWRFLRLTVTAEQECIMYNFLYDHAVRETPFNRVGAYALFFRPIDTGERAFFCSQLDVTALQHAGFLHGIRPYATSPAALYDLIHTSGEFEYFESTHPVRTKHTLKRMEHQLATREFRNDTLQYIVDDE